MTKTQFSTGLSGSYFIELPYRISRRLFNALSPLDQDAAKALEQRGKILIVDDRDQDRPG
jgi:hypothetical protein